MWHSWAGLSAISNRSEFIARLISAIIDFEDRAFEAYNIATTKYFNKLLKQKDSWQRKYDG